MKTMLWGASSLLFLLVGTYLGAFIISSTPVFWERFVSIVTMAVSVVSALAASWMVGLNFYNSNEEKRQRKWKHFKPLLVSVMQISLKSSRIARLLSGKGMMGTPLEQYADEWNKELVLASNELHNVIVELQELWGDYLPIDYCRFLETYGGAVVGWEVERADYHEFYSTYEVEALELFENTKRVVRDFSGMHNQC